MPTTLYDQRLLLEFGGGAVHFCGHGDHYISSLCKAKDLYAVNLSQAHLNDMETIFANTVDCGINIVGLQRNAAMDAVKNGRSFHGRVQTWG